MMFGTRERFPYFQCRQCDCLQIAEFPMDMARHYPPDYYSFSAVEAGPQPLWKRRLKAMALRHRLEGKGFLGGLVSRFVPLPATVEQWFAPAGIRTDSAILEVGCGQGHLMRHLAAIGFKSLTGVDPYVAGDIAYPDGVRIFRRKLEDMQGTFDLVMMHHAYEHMPDPLGVLRQSLRLLNRGGRLLLRIPLVSSEVWNTYGLDWVQLDAPRHFFLHSRKSLELAASKGGFRVDRVIYDSTGFQFWGSEQYRMDLPLFSKGSHALDPAASPFPPERIREWDARALELNRAEAGDQACFILAPI